MGQEEVLELINGSPIPLSAHQIAEQLETGYKSISHNLMQLEKHNFVEKIVQPGTKNHLTNYYKKLPKNKRGKN